MTANGDTVDDCANHHESHTADRIHTHRANLDAFGHQIRPCKTTGHSALMAEQLEMFIN